MNLESEYTYTLPRWFIALFLVAGFAAPMAFFVGVALLERSWWIGLGGGTVVLLEACFAAWLWSKIRVVVDSERIRWPLIRRELQWSEVRTSRLIRVLGLDYARVLSNDGKVHWIALSTPGGRELKKRITRRLGLDAPH